MRRWTWRSITGVAWLQAHWRLRRHFHAQALTQIAQRIGQAEAAHAGELVVAIETGLPRHEADSRLRALEVFGRLRVWDTPLNTGVLLYLVLAHGRIEIVADRGIRADDAAWQAVCRRLQASLAAGQYLPGVLAAIDEMEVILHAGCPPSQADGSSPNLLADEPVLL